MPIGAHRRKVNALRRSHDFLWRPIYVYHLGAPFLYLSAVAEGFKHALEVAPAAD